VGGPPPPIRMSVNRVRITEIQLRTYLFTINPSAHTEATLCNEAGEKSSLRYYKNAKELSTVTLLFYYNAFHSIFYCAPVLGY
jgi:hypothetical protein